MTDQAGPTDNLPPTQSLILEVLAARHRLGEHYWTMESRLRPHLDKLVGAGLVHWQAAPTYRSVRVWLTDAGRSAVLSGDYELPDVVKQRDEAQGMLARVVRLAETWDDGHGDQVIRALTST